MYSITMVVDLRAMMDLKRNPGAKRDAPLRSSFFHGRFFTLWIPGTAGKR
jgi:hypothetical protein